MIILNILAASLFSFLNKFSYNFFIIVLPYIAIALDTSFKSTQLSLSCFFLGAFLANVFITPLSDRIGHLRFVYYLLPVFIAGSVICACLHKLAFLYAGTCLMGMGASAANTLGKALVYDGNRKLHRLAIIIAAISLIGLWAPTIAMIAGGKIAQYFGWHYIFIINAVLGLALLLYSLKLKTKQIMPAKQSFMSHLKNHLKEGYYFLLDYRFLPFAIANALSSACLFVFLTAGFYTIHYSIKTSLHTFSLYTISFSIAASIGLIFVMLLSKKVAITTLTFFAALVSLVAAIALTAFSHSTSLSAFFIPMAILMIGSSMLSSYSKSLLMHRFQKHSAGALSMAFSLQLAAATFASFLGAHIHFPSGLHFSIAILLFSMISFICIAFDSAKAGV